MALKKIMKNSQNIYRLILKSEKDLEARKIMYLLKKLIKLINTINRFYRNVSVWYKQRHNERK